MKVPKTLFTGQQGENKIFMQLTSYAVNGSGLLLAKAG